VSTKPCALICGVPPALQREWGENLAKFIARFRPAALVLYPPFDRAPGVIEAAKPVDLAVLLHRDAAAAKELHADGVYLDADQMEAAKARDILGSGALIGAASYLNRHDAMEKAESGADFIVFRAFDEQSLAAAAELCAWWDELTQIPVALALRGPALPADLFITSRPDFLFVDESATAGESLTFATEFGLQSEV